MEGQRIAQVRVDPTGNAEAAEPNDDVPVTRSQEMAGGGWR
jgi:hypothetical protein